MNRWIVVGLVMAAGCRPFVAMSYDASSHVQGPLANVMNAPTSAPRQTTLAADAPAAALPPTHSYALAFGAGTRNLELGVGVYAHEVSAASVAIPDGSGSGPHYVTSSSSLDVRWTWLRLGHFSTSLHFGPTGAVILDRTTGATAWGQGVRYGAQLAVTYAGFAAFVDYYQNDVSFDDGPAPGYSKLSGMMLGVGLRQ
jgi:hypothetical protein